MIPVVGIVIFLVAVYVLSVVKISLSVSRKRYAKRVRFDPAERETGPREC